MKYMGSKRVMLRNGLGSVISDELNGRKRFIDLFSGSGAVSWHVARTKSVEVTAVDLQAYSKILADAVLCRINPVDPKKTWSTWVNNASEMVRASKVAATTSVTAKVVAEARYWAQLFPEGSITQAYGGHYYSPLQAVWIDALRCTVPKNPLQRSLCLGALITGASRCAAAPGHTAQPFQPTPTALRFLEDSWKRDLPGLVQIALSDLSSRFALRPGEGITQDANKFASTLRSNDLVFVDPPYSGVHYSRFYHVLESIARGHTTEVSGVGRYPAQSERPRSDYSMKTTAEKAIIDLLKTVASRGADVILTFPDHDCSNGLSGKRIIEIASDFFSVQTHSVASVFSTLGGVTKETLGNRAARQTANELILVLREK